MPSSPTDTPEPDTPPPASAGRRHALLIAVAGLAAAAGGWWAGQRGEPAPAADGASAQRSGGTSQAAAGSTGEVDEFWAQVWPDPQDRPVALARYRGRPLLINFWGTWCPPCLNELPELNEFARAHEKDPRGWQVLGIAVDRVESVRTFVAKSPLAYTTVVPGMDGVEWTRKLGSTSGSLPFSLLIDAQGRTIARLDGATTAAELQRRIAAAPGTSQTR